jgi:hypothetical protein
MVKIRRLRARPERRSISVFFRMKSSTSWAFMTLTVPSLKIAPGPAAAQPTPIIGQ